MRRLSSTLLALAGLACAAGLALAADEAGQIAMPAQVGVRVGVVECAAIKEASGIAASHRNAGVLWVHNDSGDTARVFAISTTGKLLGTYNLSGVTAQDWEDIAIGPGPAPGRSYIYVGDMGDNVAVRKTIVVYRVAEPEVSAARAPVTVSLGGVEKFTLRYEDGSRDAEALMVDPVTGDLYVVSKRDSRSRVYRAAASELNIFGTVTLRRVATLPWGWVTAADISSDGSEIIVRGYERAMLWHRPATGNLWDVFKTAGCSVPLVAERQGEAIGFSSDGKSYYTLSEGASQPLYNFPLASMP